MSEGTERLKSQPFKFITGKIRNKLLVLLIGIAVGTLLVAAVAIITMEISSTTLKQVVESDGRVVQLVQESQQELLLAREQDQLYQLNAKKVGFQNARDNYYAKAMAFLDHVDNLLKEILSTEPDEKANVDLINGMRKELRLYQSSFTEVVEKIENRGFKDTGLVGELGSASNEVETLVDRLNLDDLKVTLLNIRQNEKDYLLLGERNYIINLHEAIETFKTQLSAYAVSSELKDDLVHLVDIYAEKFDQIVNLDKEIVLKTSAYRAVFGRILPDMRTMVEVELAQQAEEIGELEELNTLSLIVVVITATLSILGALIAAFFFSGRLTKQIDNIMGMFGSIGIGDFSARADIVTQDELGEMAESLNAMLDNTLTLIQSRDERDSIQSSIMKLLTEISDLADGDLTARAEVTEDITGAIADSFNAMAEELSRVVRGVKEASQHVGDSSHTVNEVTKKLSVYSEEQAEKISEAISMVENMATKIRAISNDAGQSSTISDQALKSAQEGSAAVKKTNDAMASIKENMRMTARTMKRLGESSQEIGNIIQIINDIADRTSILALNASIQAAMAGEAGRGFAVVAEEVQRLAERSASSTKQIESLINTIQTDITVAGTSMETSIQNVMDGTQLADQAYLKLGQIEDVSQQLALVIQSISETASQQAQESSSVTSVMQEVGKLTEQTTTSARETTASMEEITLTSEQLEESIAAFKIDDDTVLN